ncbi:APC family permease [Nonomuraea sp. NPDC049158]|uniref:APC family permease n=1 Tax=Nonomuraea sp. NPDC049158 TaxID=3155649 RepID=UPI003406C870
MKTSPPVKEPADIGDRHRLSVIGGLAALSLDAMASVAYGPEAIVLVLALAGGAGLGFTIPVTFTIAALLAVLTLSYRQVIAAFPQGGGAYGVAKTYLGRRSGLVAAASLIIDYVLNVAVSVAAGVAALTSAFPELLPYTVWICLAVLALVTAINLKGIAHSARAFIAPTAIYVGAILLVIVAGLLRSEPAVDVSHQVSSLQTVGVLLLLKAFANGCASLTGVEAIANAVPSFKQPRVRRAQRAEVALGALLAVMLLGIAALIEKFAIAPADGVTVLAQVTQASLGDGPLFYLVQFSTVVLLALAANTSFGGLPVLAQLLAGDNNLPHFFALRADRQVHRYGIAFLTVTSALLLVVAGGEMNLLVPLFAIGVFVGFTLSQAGMVRHWVTDRPAGWRWRALLNGFGALLTFVAAIVVPVHAVTRLTRDALAAALSLGDRVVAVNITHPEDERQARAFAEDWDRWDPGVELVQLFDAHRRLDQPLLGYLAQVPEPHVFVLIAEVEPEHAWQRMLQNQRGAVLARALRRRTDAVVCRMRFRVS